MKNEWYGPGPIQIFVVAKQYYNFQSEMQDIFLKLKLHRGVERSHSGWMFRNYVFRYVYDEKNLYGMNEDSFIWFQSPKRNQEFEDAIRERAKANRMQTFNISSWIEGVKRETILCKSDRDREEALRRCI